MGDLTSLYLKAVYDSAEHHIVDDLIVPLLSNSVEYCRGVGYFCSGWLRVASIGLCDFISSGGRPRIIMSPILEEKDWQAIIRGYEARENEALRKSLVVAVEDLAQSLETDTLSTFAWMISDGVLDLRFAVPRESYRRGDYHDKVAYFRDSRGNCVAIHGSFNDSVQGTLNGEAFSVFRSWDDGQLPYVEQHVTRLDRLWDNESLQFYAFTLPTAVKQQIVKLRGSRDRPYVLPRTDVAMVPSSPDIPHGIQLHDYQQEAILAWQENRCCGIFEMATGSGKTYTALGCAVEELRKRGKLAVVVLVPYTHLLNQWKKDCEAFGFNPILCGSGHPRWRPELRSAVSDFRLTKQHLCIVAVHRTASDGAFLRAFDGIPEDEKVLIADEVHGLGATKLRNALQDGFAARLGLSATPHRWYDREGTQILFDYFKTVCYEFTLKDAIERQFLVPYRYKPQLVHLTEEEEYEVSRLSALIGQLIGRSKRKDLEDTERMYLEKALRDRAMIVKGAHGKTGVLQHLIRRIRHEGGHLQHSLFYCPEGKHHAILQLLKHEGIMAHEFVGTVSSSGRKRVLEQFEKGHITSLVAMKCLDEGVDVPATRTAFFIASTTNPKEFIQRRGRVLRRAIDKTHACIYDFIVVPSAESRSDVAKYLLEREMPRFAEFADLAENCFAARNVIRPLLDKYQMLRSLDMKPWDVYHEQNPEIRDEVR